MCVRITHQYHRWKKVVVNKGELLFLNQFTKHEILKAGQNDIAINFMVLPEFLMWLIP